MQPLTVMLAKELQSGQEYQQLQAISVLEQLSNNSFVPAAAAPLCATGVLAHLGQQLFSAEEATQTTCLTALSQP